MNAAKQAAWLSIALIILAFSGWYFAGSGPVAKLDAKTLSTTPDAIVTNLTVRQFNTKGSLANYLQTPLMHHIPQDNTHTLQSPHILVTQPEEQQIWDIRSHYATAVNGGAQITFTKQVVIHQQNAQNPESIFKTEELVYFPRDKLAITDKEVTFEQPGNLIQSKGMKAWLVEKRVQLSNARGTYDPKYHHKQS